MPGEQEFFVYDEALAEVAQEAIERKTGARGLRSILESAMNDIMFEIPSNDEIIECTVDEDCIKNHNQPKLTLKSDK